jgi:hypothetical protein
MIIQTGPALSAEIMRVTLVIPRARVEEHRHVQAFAELVDGQGEARRVFRIRSPSSTPETTVSPLAEVVAVA